MIPKKTFLEISYLRYPPISMTKTPRNMPCCASKAAVCFLFTVSMKKLIDCVAWRGRFSSDRGHLELENWKPLESSHDTFDSWHRITDLPIPTFDPSPRAQAETVQVKRMTETSMRQQQYMEHGLSKLTVPSYGDMGEEAFGRLGRVLAPLTELPSDAEAYRNRISAYELYLII